MEADKFLEMFVKITDQTITDVMGERMGFAVFLFPVNKNIDKKSRIHYGSNCEREDMIKALRSMLMKWESGQMEPVKGVHPRNN